MGEIRVNCESGSEKAAAITTSASGLKQGALSPSDDRTTLIANQGLKDAFQSSQDIVQTFSAAMISAGTVSNSIAAAFRWIDDTSIQSEVEIWQR